MTVGSDDNERAVTRSSAEDGRLINGNPVDENNLGSDEIEQGVCVGSCRKIELACASRLAFEQTHLRRHLRKEQ